MITEFNKPTEPPPKGGKPSKKPSASDNSSDSSSKDQPGENWGTLIIDATCAPQNIRFPQDVNILNEGREKLENIICSICYAHNLYRPRMYRKNVRKDYLNFARSRKSTLKKIRNAIKKQLSYIKRDLDYIRWFADYGYEADDKQKALIKIIEKVYEHIERYYQWEGHYSERVIVDKIYRSRANLQSCKSKVICLSGPSLGRPKKIHPSTKELNILITRIM